MVTAKEAGAGWPCLSAIGTRHGCRRSADRTAAAESCSTDWRVAPMEIGVAGRRGSRESSRSDERVPTTRFHQRGWSAKAHATSSQWCENLVVDGRHSRTPDEIPSLPIGSVLVSRSGSGLELASGRSRPAARMPSNRDGAVQSSRGRLARSSAHRRRRRGPEPVARRLAVDLRPSERLQCRGLGGLARVLRQRANDGFPRPGDRSMPATGRYERDSGSGRIRADVRPASTDRFPARPSLRRDARFIAPSSGVGGRA